MIARAQAPRQGRADPWSQPPKRRAESGISDDALEIANGAGGRVRDSGSAAANSPRPGWHRLPRRQYAEDGQQYHRRQRRPLAVHGVAQEVRRDTTGRCSDRARTSSQSAPFRSPMRTPRGLSSASGRAFARQGGGRSRDDLPAAPRGPRRRLPRGRQTPGINRNAERTQPRTEK